MVKRRCKGIDDRGRVQRGCREGWWSGDRDRRKGVYSEMGEILKRDLERDALTYRELRGMDIRAQIRF